MLIVDKKILNFNIKEVHFSDYPQDIKGCDFLYFLYCKNKVSSKGFTCIEEYTSVIDLTQDLDKIWQNMGNRSVRYRVKRAEREGIKIYKNSKYEEFFQLYRSFIEKKGLKSLFDIFGVGSTSLESMKKYGTLFIAEHNNEIIAGTIFLENTLNIKAWIGVSKRFNPDQKKVLMTSEADRLIDWEVIKYAKEKGIREFDLGGLWSKNDEEKDIHKKGINSYKLELGGKTITCYSYQKFYSKKFLLAYQFYNLKNLGNVKR